MPSYRDRAAERRQVFYQPAIPLPEESRAAPKRKFAKAPTPPPPKPAPGPAPGEDGNNKGNQLLKKMGWTEGTGLGLEGEGRQAPVQTFLFAEKAGIGASKGKDTANYTGFEAYGHFAKDSVGRFALRDAPILTTTKPRLSIGTSRQNDNAMIYVFPICTTRKGFMTEPFNYPTNHLAESTLFAQVSVLLKGSVEASSDLGKAFVPDHEVIGTHQRRILQTSFVKV
jgi:hypothetical protein